MLKWRLSFSFLNTRKASNPWYLLPTIGLRPSIWKADDGRIVHVGSIAIMFLCFEAWFSIENPDDAIEYIAKLRESFKTKRL